MTLRILTARILAALSILMMTTAACLGNPKMPVVDPKTPVVDFGDFLPMSINNRSEILLRSKSNDLFIWQHGKRRSVGIKARKYGNAQLNDFDHILISGTDNLISGFGNNTALLWTSGRTRRIPLPSMAIGFDNQDNILFDDTGGIYLRTKGGQTKLLLPDTLNSRSFHYIIEGHAFNEKRHIVGIVMGPLHHFEYSQIRTILAIDRHFKYLVNPAGAIFFPFSINNHDLIVGEYRPVHRIPKLDIFAAYTQSLNTLPVLLDASLPPKSGWHLEKALGVNDSGEIIGFGLHHNKKAGFLFRMHDLRKHDLASSPHR